MAFIHNVFLVIIFLFMFAMIRSNCEVSLASVTPQRTRGNETDRLALLAIKARITDDPFEVTSSWNDSLHFCRWKGVTCGRKHQRVTELNLSTYRLRGQISPSIANLSFLRRIYLANNSFSGEIPGDIGRLFRLQALDFESNFLVGQIPKNLSLCSDLRLIYLANNNLTGEIPFQLGSLSGLFEFDVHDNKLLGKIPPDFGNMSSLRTLDISANWLEGQVPASLGRWRNLVGLRLSNNKLSGTIPQPIYNLSKLASFMVSDNQLEGSFPRDIGLTLPRIRRFGVVHNRFDGKIPISFANASDLSLLELSGNSFFGGVPGIFGSLKHLVLGKDNDLDFITSLANCTELRMFGMINSNFGGKFPISIFNLSTKLERVVMSRNSVSGNIPNGIENLVSLNIFVVGDNLLTGNIPEAIGRLKNLRALGLHNNRFSGEIPSSLGNLTSLLELSIQNNTLQGRIPSSLGNCTNLDMLDLSSNTLNGSIPKFIVELPSLTIFLDLSRNNFSGSLPSEVGKMKTLDRLDISFNQLSGVIPPSLGECTMLRILFMDHNRFEGTIPESLSSLQSIEEIHLSHNNLSGKIPSKIAELAFLSNLDLSFNDLEGEIPTGGVFSNASAISISGNRKLCGGLLQLQLKACPKKKSKKRSSFRGSKLIISLIFSILVASLVLYLMFSWWFKNKRKQQIQTFSVNPFASVSYGELLKATNGFSLENLIGEGSIGSVYKGVLEADQTAVAVKVFNLEKRGASKSFASECETLRGVRHRNLVKIITACSSIDYRGNEFKALVYELMPNGNLDTLLHPISSPTETEDPSPLTLSKRIDIAIDVASAVDYLHNNVETPIVHCDLKPSNILLDQENKAHVGDFGLSRIIQHDNAEISNNQTSSSGLKGTIGYAAPEYGMGSKVSKEGDMYSFGILLLEMFTGKRPTDSGFGEGMNINQFVKTALSERVSEIVEQGIIPMEEIESTSNDEQEQTRKTKICECCASVLKIGVVCSDEFPRARMKIDEALKELYAAKKMLL